MMSRLAIFGAKPLSHRFRGFYFALITIYGCFKFAGEVKTKIHELQKGKRPSNGVKMPKKRER